MPRLDDITLRRGSHNTREDGLCLMEAVAFFAGERHTDRPSCVCSVLNSMGIGLNDCLPDDQRVRLLQYVPKVVGTAGDGHLQARGLMAMDWIVRTYTPAWMELAGLDASALRGLSEIRSWDDVEAAQTLLDDARERSDAARDAAWDAAWDAVWDAAWDAARDAACAAAWAAARAAARDAACAAAWAAARDAAWDAARAAAWAALERTRDDLREDAIRLFERMIALGSEQRSGYELTPAEVELVG